MDRQDEVTVGGVPFKKVRIDHSALNKAEGVDEEFASAAKGSDLVPGVYEGI